MKQKITLSLFLLALVFSAFAQKDKNLNKRRLFGLHFNALDVNSPKRWKEDGGPRKFDNLRNLDLGFSASYWKLITPLIDFSAKGTMMFHDYSGIDRGTYSPDYNQVGIEIEPSLNFKSFKDESILNPFLTAGIGAGLYSNKLGAYVPLGVGLQSNLSNTTYLLLQAQYRYSLTKEVLRNNLFYSLGVAQTMGRDGAAKAVVAAPAVPVAVVPPPPVVVDTDGDGIPDSQDKCPNVAGIAKYGGCPIPDTDGDGINDEQDKCPTVKGLARYQGCPIPDADNDGVNDEVDKCPNVAGPASNDGCPEIKKEVIDKLNLDAKNILFESNSYKLLSASYKPLNDVVEVLKADPSLLVNIDGHTDNSGDAAKNKTLSQNRAEEVKKYLVSKGISADRLYATGYGQERPIADNKTSAGRAQNRRTELVVRNH